MRWSMSLLSLPPQIVWAMPCSRAIAGWLIGSPHTSHIVRAISIPSGLQHSTRSPVSLPVSTHEIICPQTRYRRIPLGAKPMQYWEVWYPKAAATGLLIGRCLIDETNTLLVHATPDYVTVAVHDDQGNRLAYAQDLIRTQESPITRLRRQGDRIIREDIWPTEADYGAIVLLPGGEAGVLKQWWNAEDRREWRWLVEFYNST